MAELLQLRPEGLYCLPGDFFIDPWRPVERAIITHAHADHARWGMQHYLAARSGETVLRTRLGNTIALTTLNYGERIDHHGVTISLHPAGHVLGSSQVRMEYQGQVAVVSGDYKLADDPTTAPFESVRCHHFVTESTFGLPVYRWQPSAAIFASINAWWNQNRAEQRNRVLYAYSLGKAQRLLAGIDPSIGPIFTHGGVDKINQAYQAAGVTLPQTHPATAYKKAEHLGSLIIAPPSAQNSSWLRRFEPCSEGVASGWMSIRGFRRRRSVDRGFVLSDHADWQGLNQAITDSGAETVSVTHGSSETLSRWLRSRGLDARVLATEFQGEADEPAGEEA